MWLLPRLRLALGRHRWLHPLLVGLAALLVWWQAASVQGAAQRARRAWGATTVVWVADDAASPGDRIAMHREKFPRAMVPGDALDDPPADATAARDVAAGAVLVPADLTSPDDVPRGWVIFALPIDRTPAMHRAEYVAVFSGGRRACDGRAAAVSAVQVEVAVPPDCAAGLSADLAAGDVVLARLP